MATRPPTQLVTQLVTQGTRCAMPLECAYFKALATYAAKMVSRTPQNPNLLNMGYISIYIYIIYIIYIWDYMGYAWIINHLGGMHIHVTSQSCGFCHKNKDVSMKHRESSHEYII